MSESDSITPPPKTCTKCGHEHPATLEYFHARAGSKLHSWCKECDCERTRTWRAANAERVAAYNRSWQAANPEYHPAYKLANRAKAAEQNRVYYVANVERITEVHRAWQAANPEKLAESQRAYEVANREKRAERKRARHDPEKRHAYYAEHIDEYAAYGHAYQIAHPEKVAAGNHNRRARKLGNGGRHTAEDIKAQYARQKGRCAYCHEKVGGTYHTDHVMPLILGGSDGKENIVITCPTCNLSKGAKHPMDFSGRLL